MTADPDDVAEAVEARLRARFGDSPESASVTFLGTETIRVLRFVCADAHEKGSDAGEPGPIEVVYATVGCSAHPMVDAADAFADPVRGPRAELVMPLLGGVDGVLRPLAVLAAAPAVEGLVLAEDALVDLGEPLWPGAAFTAVLLGESGIEPVVLTDPADPVRFLRVTPVTPTEAAWVRVRGAEALREAWAEAGIDPRDPFRRAVGL